MWGWLLLATQPNALRAPRAHSPSELLMGQSGAPCAPQLAITKLAVSWDVLPEDSTLWPLLSLSHVPTLETDVGQRSPVRP